MMGKRDEFHGSVPADLASGAAEAEVARRGSSPAGGVGNGVASADPDLTGDGAGRAGDLAGPETLTRRTLP